MLEPYVQKALLEGLMLAVAGGVMGSWIVLHRLAFFTHAVGTASFPGLVLAGPWGVAPQLSALATGAGLAGGVQELARRRPDDTGAATGVLLVAALAGGVVLASDVYGSGAAVDRLLFGSLFAVSGNDLALTALVTAAVLGLNAALRRPWLAAGFEGSQARLLGMSSRAAEVALLLAIAAAVVVSLDAVGALLVSAVFVLPAATVRLVARDMRSLQVGSVALAAAEVVPAVLLAEMLNVGPGPVLAVLGGAVFTVTAVVTR